jgi:hypothetical protein
MAVCLAGLLRLAVRYVPAPAARIEDPKSAADWVRAFDARRYTNRGATAGSALLARELGGMFPPGSDSADLARTLTSAGFSCRNLYSPGPWRGCSISDGPSGTFPGVIRVEVEHAEGVLHDFEVDMSFPAVVW